MSKNNQRVSTEKHGCSGSTEAPCYLLDRIKTAFSCGYELGHSDTVESLYGDSDELSQEYLDEFKHGQIETGCHWGAIDAGERYFETDCGNSFMLNDGAPRENGYVFCPFCGQVIESDR